MRDMFVGGTPPPWSRTRRKRKREGGRGERRDETGKADALRGGGASSGWVGWEEIVMTTDGMRLEEEWE